MKTIFALAFVVLLVLSASLARMGPAAPGGPPGANPRHITLYQAVRPLGSGVRAEDAQRVRDDIWGWTFTRPGKGEWATVEINVPEGARVEATDAGDLVLCLDKSNSGIDASSAMKAARRGELGLSIAGRGEP